MKNFISILLVFFLLTIGLGLLAQPDLRFSQLPPIPDENGFAGMFAGVSNGALLCMGGANFPEDMPWEGGQKMWYDHIYILEEAGEWKKSAAVLPFPLGYGVSVNYDNQVILIGGSNAKRHSDVVFGVEYQDGDISLVRSYPSLPVPLAMMSGALVGHTIYISGGLESPDGNPTSHFFALDLQTPETEREWVQLPSWPGPPRQLSVAASKDGKFYLFSGIRNFLDKDGNSDREMLRDAYVFDPETHDWTALPTMPRSLAAGPSPAPEFGRHFIIFPGGLDEETAKYPDPSTHPGFLSDLWAFNTLTQTYVQVGSLPEGASRLTLPTTLWRDQWILPNGESGPGVRTPAVFTLTDSNVIGETNR